MNNLLKALIVFGKGFDKLTSVGKAIIVSILLFVVYSAGSSGGKNELDQFIIEYNSLKKTAENTTELADSLKHQVVQLSDSAKQKEEIIKKLTINISFKERQKTTLKNNLERLERNVVLAKSDSNLTKTIAIQDTVIDNLKTQVVATEEIVREQSEIIKTHEAQSVLLNKSVALSIQRGDSLQSVISSLPATPKNSNKIFGFIPKPNRTVVGAIAFGTGVLAGVKLTK